MMIVYNLTMKVEHSILDAWLRWQKEEHIPDIMATGQFVEHKFYRLLDQDESDGITYVIQYIAPDNTHYERYIDEFAGLFHQKAVGKWGNRFVTFGTVMEVVH